MHPPRSRWPAALALSFASSVATAQTPVRLSYRAPEGCPNAESFAAALQSRGVDLQKPAPQGPRSLTIAIQRAQDTWQGSLQIGDAQATAPREVSGATCNEVSDALAAVAALALRPPPEKPSTEQEEKPSPELIQNRELLLSLEGGLASGYLPSQAVKRVELSFERNNLVGITGGPLQLVPPTLRISVSLLGGGPYRWDNNKSDFSAQLLSFAACTYLVHNPHGLNASVCSAVSAGLIGISTISEDGRKKNSYFGLGTFGAALHLRYALGSRFHVALSGGGDARLGSVIEAESPDGKRRSLASFASFYGQLGVGLHF